MTPVTFGVFYAGAGAWVTADGARALVHGAEQHGFSALWAIDHAVLPTNFAPRYESAGGAWAVPDHYPIADPLTWLAFIAATSATLRLGTAVMAAPTRSPVVLAKQAATLDVLAGGRLTLGLGSGWLPEEFAAVGVPIEVTHIVTSTRAAALNELPASLNAYCRKVIEPLRLPG